MLKLEQQVKKRTEQLNNEKQLLQTIIDTIPVMVTIYDGEVNSVFLNNAVENITGWTNEDAQHNNIMELAYPDPEYREHVLGFMAALQPVFQDLIMRTKDGRDIETTWANVKIPDGRSVGVGVDISERKELESQLIKAKEKAEENRRLLKTIVNATPDLIWVKDTNGIYLSCNKRFEDFFGKSESEIIGKTDYDFVEKELADFFRNHDNHAMNAGSATINEEEITFAIDGHSEILETIKTPLTGSNNDIIGVLGVGRDITDRKKAEEKLLKAKKEAEESEKQLRLISDNFVNGMIYQVAMLDENRRQFNYISNNVQDLYGCTVEEAKEDANLIYGKLHPDDVEGILEKEKGSIKIGCEKKVDLLEFYVKDTGIGIPAARKDAVFNRFEQADIEDKQAREGSGLGLAIVKSYVEMLGGTVWVESEENKGSTFFFTVSYKPVKSETKNEINVQNKISDKAKNLNILIVEDDDVSSLYLSTIIKDIANNIQIARNGTEAVEICKNNSNSDLVLMDIKLPGMNGLEATEKIRKFNKKIKIIAQTAHALQGDREQARISGCDDYIAKPINKGKLIEMIDRYFE